MELKNAAGGLYGFLKAGQVLFGVPMSEHTTFKTGGIADMMLLPATEEEAAAALRFLKDGAIPYVVIGRGSNLIVRDGGYRGAVVKLAENFSRIGVSGVYVTAQAGATLAELVHTAHANGLTGMEYAGGIPGSVGGAVVMNAGAYGGEIKDHVEAVNILDRDLTPARMENAGLCYGYRSSILQTNGATVLSAVFRLEEGDVQRAREVLGDLNRQRRDKQPLQYPSAGSVFKRPAGNFAGTLIEKAGLKGYAIGGAQVSEKHAGFIINTGGARASDIIALIAHVQKTVLLKSGVALEPEVKIIGED
jgi:UDP-N-acetylmuramate dehydrogenase